MGFGDYPKEYNPAIHGSYDPSRYYGPKDTAFGDLKLSQIGSWIQRRNVSPKSFAGLVSRAWWRWQMKYVQPKRTGMAPFFHIAFFGMALFYTLNHKRIRNHKNYKYH